MKTTGRREESMGMFATVSEFLYSDIAGIHGPDFYGPGYMPKGFGHVRICPLALGDLEYARASIRTTRGIVSSSWHRQGQSFVLEAGIPGNCAASVGIPTLGTSDVVVREGGTVVWKNGKFVAGAEGVTGATRDPERITFAVGSGNYKFRVSGN